MINYLLERLRVILKSIGKKEESLIDLITYLKFKKKYNKIKTIDVNLNLLKDYKTPVKLAATITFLYDLKKINLLNNVCKSLYEISKNSQIIVITNEISKKQENYLKKRIKFKSCNIKVITNKNLINNRLLPWCHIPIMKKLFKDKTISHFLYLEDDILLNKKNFTYWVNARKYLQKFNLIPAFIRTEINRKDKELYAIDFTKNSKLNNLPKIKINKNVYFINHKFPYMGMYLYDRKLMKEHLSSPSSNPDCGHGAFNINFLDKRMVNLDLMAKANIGLTWMNVPEGFFNRYVVPYNINQNKIENFCFIKHLSNKYSNIKSSFGNIKIKEIIK